MEKSPANHAQFDDADELAAAFRHVDVEFRCQDCGPFHGSLGFTALQGIEVQHLRLNRTSVSHAFKGQGRFALLVQLHSPKPCVWNGEVFESLLEESLLRVLARTAEGAARPATRHHLLEAVRRAEDYLETASCLSLRLSGICAEAGIDASVLRQACFELFGLRVTRYLALFRLVRLRRDLLTSVDGTEDIAVLAGRWGFWNLPWLRWRYRRHFAETMEFTRNRGFLTRVPEGRGSLRSREGALGAPITFPPAGASLNHAPRAAATSLRRQTPHYVPPMRPATKGHPCFPGLYTGP